MHLYLFDNDGTLYEDTSTFDAFLTHLVRYLHCRLGIGTEAALAQRQRLLEKHGTAVTAHAFAREYGWPEDEIVAETYGRIDLTSAICADPGLAATLTRLQTPCVVWTNGQSYYAQRVLVHLGVAEYFQHIIDSADVPPGKPHPDTYAHVRSMVASWFPEVTEITMVEDTVVNLKPAAALGWTTVWLCRNGVPASPPSYVTRVIRSLSEL